MAQAPNASTNFLSPEDYAQMLRQAEMENRAGLQMNQAPRHWTQALAGALNQGLSGYRTGQARERNQETKAAGNAALAAALRGEEGAADRAMSIPGFEDRAREWKMNAPQRELQQFKMDQARANAPLERKLIQSRIEKARQAGKPQTYEMGNIVVERQQDGSFKEVYKRPPTIAERILEQRLGGGQPQPTPNQPQVIPQSNAEPAPEMQPQPVADVEPQPVAQDGTPQPQNGMNFTPEEELAISKEFPQLGKIIRGEREKREAGTTLAKSTIKRGQDQILTLTDRLSDISKIQQSYKPEYLTYLGKANFEFLRQKAKTVGLTDVESKQLGDYAEFRQNAVQQVNNYIRAMTGAAMSEAEAKRLMMGVANAGSGFFDGDDPVSFKRKLDNAQQGALFALARYNMILKQNKLPGSAKELEAMMPLGKVRNIMMKKRRSLLQEAKSNNLDSGWVREQMREEFGI